MKSVVFKNINIQNFLSIGNQAVELTFNQGISLITGENRDKGGRNGVGKSSIVESLYWCLFGSTIRDIKREKIIHNLSDESCCVTLYFDIISADKQDSYILSRYINPNKVTLFCNNVDITRSSMPKTDELIKELIGATPEVFQNAVIMTANNTTPFMAQKKVDKRKFVEGVLNLTVFSDMLLQVRADYNDTKKENDHLSSLFLEKQKSLEMYQKESFKIEESKRIKILNLKEKIKVNKNKILEISNLDEKSLQESKNKLTSLIYSKKEKIEKLNKLSEECSLKYSTLNTEEQQLRFTIKQLEKDKNHLSQKTKECPTCKRSYDDVDKDLVEGLIKDLNFKLSDSNNKLKEILKDLKIQQKNCDTITEASNNLNKDISKHTEEIHSLNIIHKDISHLTNINLDIEKQIKELEESENNFISLIENISSEIKEKESQLENLQKRLSILESSKFIVSEEGVKTFIIKKMLTLLNSRLNYYLQVLEAPCKCEFNETFEEIITNDKGIECSYFNFSGGERKRIDLAILFMFQDLLRTQTGTSFSLSMYDELFDSALDEKGVDKILSILKERIQKYKESIYIISHNKAAIKAGIDQVILLEKHNGKTSIVQ